MKNKLILFGALVLLMLGIGCASGDQLRKVEQELGDLKVQIFKLRQQTEETNRRAEAEQKAAAEGRSQDRRFQADLQETLRQLQETTRVLSNRVGTQGRLNVSRASSDASTLATPLSEEEKAFNAAVLDYNRGNYPLAADGLELFLKNFPQGSKRSDALFFLGLCHYNQKAFDKAQRTFEQIIKEFPSSQQFLPAKLKRAQCLLKQGLKPAAIRAFKEIVENFSGTPEARTAQQELSDLGL